MAVKGNWTCKKVVCITVTDPDANVIVPHLGLTKTKRQYALVERKAKTWVPSWLYDINQLLPTPLLSLLGLHISSYESWEQEYLP